MLLELEKRKTMRSKRKNVVYVVSDGYLFVFIQDKLVVFSTEELPTNQPHYQVCLHLLGRV